jgi:serine/threonine protein kinase
LERVKTLHSFGFCHNDIKPENVCVGASDPSKIYLIDFGLSSTFQDNNGGHLPRVNTGRFSGNYIFAGMTACKGVSTSRRDDV